MIAIEATISGRVQGVAFRYYCKTKADALSIKGIVKNVIDGTVKLQAQGPKDKIQLLLDWCKIGSPAGEVKKVVVTPIELFNPKEFSILR